MSNQAITTHDSGLAGLGSGGVTGKPDVEKRQLVAELLFSAHFWTTFFDCLLEIPHGRRAFLRCLKLDVVVLRHRDGAGLRAKREQLSQPAIALIDPPTGFLRVIAILRQQLLEIIAKPLTLSH